MGDDHDDQRTLLVDASVCTTLADIGSLALLPGTDGTVSMPHAVVEETPSEPAATELERARGDWLSTVAIPRRLMSGSTGSKRPRPTSADRRTRTTGPVTYRY